MMPPKCQTVLGGIMQRATILLATALLLAGAVGCSKADESSSSAETPTIPSATTTAVPTPSPSVSLSPECRTWIKAELLDNSEEIDSEAGARVCGGLSDDELSAAIEQVTDELSAEITPSVG